MPSPRLCGVSPPPQVPGAGAVSVAAQSSGHSPSRFEVSDHASRVTRVQDRIEPRKYLSGASVDQTEEGSGSS